MRRVGNVTYTFFWADLWLGGSSLCVRFKRLFDLIENKSSTVVDMFVLG